MVEDGDASAAAVPAPEGGLTISSVLEYDNPLLTHQTFRYASRGDSFACDLARARTFCLEEEVALIKANRPRGNFLRARQTCRSAS